MHRIGQQVFRLSVSMGGVAIITALAYQAIPVNATTAGFGYLLFVLSVASVWGFLEAAISSILATLAFNLFFLPPVGRFTIADPQNWVALFTFLATSLIASRLSAIAKRRAAEAVERQQDVERLYTFSRAILLIDHTGPFPRQLAQKLSEIFELSAVVLYDRRSDQYYRAGPSDFDGMEEQLRAAALQGTSFADTSRNRMMTAVRLGSEPIASLALQGPRMPDSVLQGMANLVAIGLERAKSLDLAHQVEAARQTEKLRTALIDAMAHEFKTPLTSIKAATTSLLASPDQPRESRVELAGIADEEADHLRDLIDNAVDMARLDTAHIDIHATPSSLAEAVQEVVASMKTAIDSRSLVIDITRTAPLLALDQRLIRLAIKQLLDNALKYSAPGTPIQIRVLGDPGAVTLEVANQGEGIPALEQPRIFERFYRRPGVHSHVPGSGLGLSIAHRIVQAHKGDLTVTSQPGETTFRLTLPVNPKEGLT